MAWKRSVNTGASSCAASLSRRPDNVVWSSCLVRVNVEQEFPDPFDAYMSKLGMAGWGLGSMSGLFTRSSFVKTETNCSLSREALVLVSL